MACISETHTKKYCNSSLRGRGNLPYLGDSIWLNIYEKAVDMANIYFKFHIISYLGVINVGAIGLSC